MFDTREKHLEGRFSLTHTDCSPVKYNVSIGKVPHRQSSAMCLYSADQQPEHLDIFLPSSSAVAGWSRPNRPVWSGAAWGRRCAAQPRSRIRRPHRPWEPLSPHEPPTALRETRGKERHVRQAEKEDRRGGGHSTSGWRPYTTHH